jgi:cytochrome c peroxidase
MFIGGQANPLIGPGLREARGCVNRSARKANPNPRLLQGAEVMRRVSRSWLAAAALWAWLGPPSLAAVGQDEPLQPLPETQLLDERKVALGRALFRDPRLARDDSVACISCHSPQSGGADARKVPVGAGGVTHIFNSPSAWNAGLNFRQQWTGGAATLEEVIDRVVNSPMVFNSSWAEIVGKLAKDDAFVRQLKASYPEGVTQASLSDALAAYQRWSRRRAWTAFCAATRAPSPTTKNAATRASRLTAAWPAIKG